MAEVLVEHLSKKYAGNTKTKMDAPAVDDISFTVQDKEFMVLVGPSGCGKSTLLRMIAGLEDISSGSILIDGERINDRSPKDRDIAMVFQNYALYPHMTVYDNMAFGLKLKRYSKTEIRSRVSQTAALLEIEDLLQRKPKMLSGGQRQRVAIGRAIIRRPKVFLFDEPLSNLDAKLRTQMRIELQKLHREIDATMIYVTHDQTEAMTLGDRIAVLNKGKLMQMDTPMNLYDRPANRFVAGFIGSPAMNFMKGTIERGPVSDTAQQPVSDAAQSPDGFYFVHGSADCRFPLGQDARQTWGASLDRPVVLGIRPEDLRIGEIGEDDQQDSMPDVRATTVAYENMGNEQFVYLSLAGQTLIARRPPAAMIVAGTVQAIRFRKDKIICFDEASGETIGASAAGIA